MAEELTAQEAADAGRVAFKVEADTPLYEKPEPTARTLETLPAGSRITISRDDGPFLYVITSADRFGYIPDETPVTLLTWTPEIERQAAAKQESGYPQSLVTARDVFSAGLVAPTIAGSVVPITPVVPLSARDDEPFTPAPPPTPAERILIYDRIGSNKRRTLLILGGFVLFTATLLAALGVIGAVYSGYDPTTEPGLVLQIAAFTGILAFGMGIFLYFVSTATVLAISGAREVSKEEEPVLYRIVENLSIGSGLPMPKVYVINDSAPNAFATGRNPSNAVVAATTGLLDKLQKRELEAVMAHEMSHVGNYDIRLMTTVAVLVGLVALIADYTLRFTWYGAGARSGNRGKGGGAIAVVLLAIALAFVALSPIIASIMRSALSRQREYLADSSGALLCRNPDALADALEKIAMDPEPLEVANKATAHMYIANPLREHQSFLNNLFATHPPIEDRIQSLRAM
jgi:heat shock protein HtpX